MSQPATRSLLRVLGDLRRESKCCLAGAFWSGGCKNRCWKARCGGPPQGQSTESIRAVRFGRSHGETKSTKPFSLHIQHLLWIANCWQSPRGPTTCTLSRQLAFTIRSLCARRKMAG